MNGRYLCAPDYPLILSFPNTGQGLNPYFGNQQMGVWTMRDYHQAATWRVAVSSTGDPNYANVKFVCNFQPDIRATSQYGPFWNEVGGSAQFQSGLTPLCDTRNTLYGNFDLRCVGLAEHGALCHSAADWTIGASDFDLECYTLLEGASVSNFLDCRNGANGNLPTIYQTAATKVNYLVNAVDRIVGTTILTLGVWHHIAVSRVAGNTRLFLDGVQEGAIFVDTTVYAAPALLAIGNSSGFGSASINGHIAGARYTVGGNGRYSAGFAPDFLPFPTYLGGVPIVPFAGTPQSTHAQETPDPRRQRLVSATVDKQRQIP